VGQTLFRTSFWGVILQFGDDISPFLLKLSQNYFTVYTVLHAPSVNHKKWVNIAPGSICILEIPPGGMNISRCHLGKKYEKRREKGGECKRKKGTM
jgi:hypothetical protein